MSIGCEAAVAAANADGAACDLHDNVVVVGQHRLGLHLNPRLHRAHTMMVNTP